jgi:hypothetical protein
VALKLFALHGLAANTAHLEESEAVTARGVAERFQPARQPIFGFMRALLCRRIRSRR